MLAAVLSIAVALTTSSDANWEGALTSVSGSAVIERDGQQLRAVRGAGVRPFDRIRADGDGSVQVYLRAGYAVQLAPGSTLVLEHDANDWTFVLESGELRLVSREGARIHAPHGRLVLAQGIARVRADAHTLNAFMEKGNALFLSAGGDSVRLPESHLATVNQGKLVTIPATLNERQWTIDAAEYQLASVRQPLPVIPASLQKGPQQKKSPIQAPEQPVEEETEEDAEEPSLRSAPEEAPETAESVSSRNTATSVVGSLGLGAIASTSAGLASSGSVFSDANQATNQGQLFNDPATPFPGNIHLVTAETRYGFADVNLTAAESQALFPSGDPTYYSIGTGALPTGQVVTDFVTGTDPTPTVIPVPRFDAYLIRLDQYGIPDPGLDPAGALNNTIGLAGLLGSMPAAPTVLGATPVQDNRADLNSGATFALGEFRLTPSGSSFDLAIRRSDQDRLIVKDPNNNDANDVVTPNSQIASFDDVADPRFQPQAPTVKVPTANSFNSLSTRFSNLDTLRRAATTTLLADQLFDYAQRTGQTRFVIREDNGAQSIIDITGFQRQ